MTQLGLAVPAFLKILRPLRTPADRLRRRKNAVLLPENLIRLICVAAFSLEEWLEFGLHAWSWK